MTGKHVKLETQRGSMLLEALVATGLAAALILSASAAVLGALHAEANGVERSALTDHALNVLSDLREGTAYDPKALAGMVGHTASAAIPSVLSSAAPQVSTTISVLQAANSAPPIATVTVSAPDGASITLRQALFVEAPAPGSIVDQPSPTPAPLP